MEYLVIREGEYFWHINDYTSPEMARLTRANKPRSHYLQRLESAIFLLGLCRIRINLIRCRLRSHSIPASSGQIWRLISYFRPNTIKLYWTDASFHTSVPVQWTTEPTVCRRPERDIWVWVRRLWLWLGKGPRNETCGASLKEREVCSKECIYYSPPPVTLLCFHVCSCSLNHNNVTHSSRMTTEKSPSRKWQIMSSIMWLIRKTQSCLVVFLLCSGSKCWDHSIFWITCRWCWECDVQVCGIHEKVLSSPVVVIFLMY